MGTKSGKFVARGLKLLSVCILQVMKHDAIMDSAVADSALIEAEAELVAQEAVKKLERSRKMCFRYDHFQKY